MIHQYSGIVSSKPIAVDREIKHHYHKELLGHSLSRKRRGSRVQARSWLLLVFCGWYDSLQKRREHCVILLYEVINFKYI